VIVVLFQFYFICKHINNKN